MIYESERERETERELLFWILGEKAWAFRERVCVRSESESEE